MAQTEWAGTISFGYWLQRRRKTLDLTRAELAKRVGCSPVTIKKIERDERRPSRQIAGLLAEHLAVPEDERDKFVRMARGEFVPVMASPLEIEAIPAQNFAGLDDEFAGQEDIPFVGRARQLARLESALDKAKQGSGQIEFVIGGAGRGKTTLVQEFARQAGEADPNVLAVSGYCDAHTGIGDPYLPFREILSLLTGNVEARWAGGLLTQAQARRLWEMAPVTIPALVEHGPDLIGSFVSAQALLNRASTFASGDASWFKQLEAIAAGERRAGFEQRRIFAQLAAVLKALAQHRPILLLLEDLHWIDVSSSALLFHLSRQLGDSAVFIVGTYRPEEVTQRGPASSPGSGERHPLADILSELKRRHGDIWLDLGEVDPVEGRQFVDAYLDTEPNRLDEAFREKLFQHTAGHALFTTELLQEMQERGDLYQDEEGNWVAGESIDWQSLPAKVEGAIERRIGRLEKNLQTVVTVASVEGETFTAEIVARVLQLNEWELTQMLSRELDKQHRLVKAQALEMIGRQRLSRYRFRHHLFQHYLYHRLDEMERAYLHEQVGRELEALCGEQLELVAVQLARHFQEAGLIADAVSYLSQAADRARRLFALDEAIQLYSRAIDLAQDHPGSIDAQAQLGLIELRGETHGQAAHFEQAAADLLLILQAAQETADKTRERAVLMRLGWIFRRAGIRDKADRRLHEALALSRSLDDQRAMADALFHLGTLSWDAGENHQALAYHQEAVDICRQLGLTDLVAVQALHGLAEASWMAGEFDAAISLFSESLALARQIGDRGYEAENLHMTGLANTGTMGKGNYQEALDLHQQALVISESAGMAWHSAIVLHWLGHAQACTGDYEQGLAMIRQSLSMGEMLGVARIQLVAYEHLGDLHLDLNLLDAATEFLKLGIELSLRFNIGFWLSRLQARLAICRLRQGDLSVEPELLEALEMARGNGQGLHAGQCLEGLAELYLTRGEAGSSGRYAEELLAMAEKNGLREMVARAHRWRGEALLAEEQLEDAEGALKQAAELAKEIGRVRLMWDVHEALHLLYKTRGRDELAGEHKEIVQSIVKQIGENLQEPEMRAGLPG